MTDIAALTKQCHDTGFEEGSVVAITAVLAYLDQNNLQLVAEGLHAAWEDGRVAAAYLTAKTPAPPSQLPAEHFEPGPPTLLPAVPKMDREQAATMGFTGNSCSCGSMMMVRNGTCEKCLTCGTTTGCS